jgi:hypothetical protein
MNQWAAEGLGIEWVVLMNNNPDGSDPTAEGALQWKTVNNLDSAWVFPDADFALAYEGHETTPYLVLVDPRTMKLVFATGGYDDANYAEAEHLARQNQYP